MVDFNSLLSKGKEIIGLETSQAKKEESLFFWESPIKFTDKLISTGKIIGDTMLPLSTLNSRFHMSTLNPDAEIFYKRFLDFTQREERVSFDIKEIFSKEIAKYEQHFLLQQEPKNQKKKELVFKFWDWELKNRQERGNICSYDYYKWMQKAWKIVMYMFNNDSLKPIDVIAVQKESELIRKEHDIKTEYGLLSRILKDPKRNKDGQWLSKIQEKGAIFYPFINFDINLYPVENYLRDLYYFFYYMTFSLFFRKSEEMKDYYKSIVIDVRNILSSLLNDVDIRRDISWMIKNRDWYSLGQSLNGLIPWNYDVTYYYCFLSRDQKLYPCYIKVNNVEETSNKMIIHATPIWWNIWFAHKTILDVFKKTNVLEPKSFIYENLTSFNVKKDVNFMSYHQLEVIKDIISSYKTLFW